MKNEFSLNDWIICELTPHGRALLVEHYKNNPVGMIDPERLADMFKADKGNKYKFQISEFGYIFGKDLWAGAENVTVDSRFEIIKEKI